MSPPRRSAWLKMTLLVLVLVGGGVWWWMQPREEAPVARAAPAAPALPVTGDTGMGRWALAGASPARGLIAFGARQWQACDTPGEVLSVEEHLRGETTVGQLADYGQLRDGGWGLYVEALVRQESQTGALHLLDVQRLVRVDGPVCPPATPAVEAVVTLSETDSLLITGQEVRRVGAQPPTVWDAAHHGPRLGDTLRLIAPDSLQPLDLQLWRRPCVRRPQREVVALQARLRLTNQPALDGCAALGPLGLDGDRLGLERPSGQRLKPF